MLRFLFPRLTADPARGAELFRWVVGQTRAPHWYVAGGLADTVDGRFAMLATIAARIKPLVAAGRSVEQVVAAKPTAGFDEKFGKGFVGPDKFAEMVAGSLARR